MNPSDISATAAQAGQIAGSAAATWSLQNPGVISGLVTTIILAVVDGVVDKFITPMPWLKDIIKAFVPKVGQAVEDKIEGK